MTSASLILSPEALQKTYGGDLLTRLPEFVRVRAIVSPSADWPRHRAALADTEVLFSGWGAPLMDEEFLGALPRLRAVFYGGGSVRYFVTDELWRRGVRVTTANHINAIPVAEFVHAAIVLSLKRVWHYARLVRREKTFPVDRPMAGAYGSTVGLVSYGVIGRLVRQRLASHRLEVLVYDPFLAPEAAREHHVTLVTLEELFARADIVSLHTPSLPSTAGMIKREHFERMKPGATFINTARGEIVDEPAMIDVLARRPEIEAILDVTAPEPPDPRSPLYSLPNVVLTPHIAGSMERECLRMGEAMLDEFRRYLKGEPLRWEITPERAAIMA